MTAVNALKDPFPTEVLPILNFGKADGRLDNHLEDAFVLTNSTKKFYQDSHSIIIGPMGAGKSALFELVKNKSNVISSYKDCVIVPIEEQISFTKLEEIITKLSAQIDNKYIYQLIWKFHIAISIAEKVSKYPGFPNNSHEKEINTFLKLVESKDHDESILGRFMGLIKIPKLSVKTNISSTPIKIDAEFEVGGDRSKDSTIINIDRILTLCVKTNEVRGCHRFLVIIDRIDKFVAGIEYEYQRRYIEALLEVDDDLSISYKGINRKIFLRDDLFSRLNYESLGYDKVNDNTLRLEWTDSELLRFIARRLYVALKNQNLLSNSIVLLSTDLSDFNLDGLDVLRTLPIIPLWLKKKLFDLDSINKERSASLKSHLDKAIITKVFPKKISHKDSGGKESECCIFDFLLTHFKDGHNKVTPRNLLRFLKEVVDVASAYYEENPDQISHVKEVDGDFEWTLFKGRCVYYAYLASKKEFIRGISKVENEWTRYFATFLGKRGNKKVFDFNWIKSIVDLEEDKVISFIAYLEHIGFLTIDDPHPLPTRRTYRLPIIYMPSST